jgi:t-SNARE complex subunit (syntaxin)
VNLIKDQNRTIAKLEESLTIAEKKMDLEKRENEINQKMLEVKDREIAGINRNFEQMKEVADRAIKLAETGKPSIWQTYGPLAVIAIIVVTIASAF